MVSDIDAALLAQTLEKIFYAFRIAHVVDDLGLESCETIDKLLEKTPFTDAVYDLGHHPRRHDAAQTALAFQNDRLRPAAAGGDRGGCSGRAAAADDDIVLPRNRDGTLRFRQHFTLKRKLFHFNKLRFLSNSLTTAARNRSVLLRRLPLSWMYYTPPVRF